MTEGGSLFAKTILSVLVRQEGNITIAHRYFQFLIKYLLNPALQQSSIYFMYVLSYLYQVSSFVAYWRVCVIYVYGSIYVCGNILCIWLTLFAWGGPSQYVLLLSTLAPDEVSILLRLTETTSLFENTIMSVPFHQSEILLSHIVGSNS